MDMIFNSFWQKSEQTFTGDRLTVAEDSQDKPFNPNLS